MLTCEQQKLRAGRLTASVVGKLMHGTEQDILCLWQAMVGHDDYEPDDLTWVWPVRLGETTENLNLMWWEYKFGRTLTRKGEVVIHPKHEWACATLDAFDEGLIGPVDAKHVGGFEPRERICARYYPQLVWQMDCTGARRAALSIIEGAREPVAEIAEWDADYSAELWRRAEAFMHCVENLVPPVAAAPVAPPTVAERVADMASSNAWCSFAGQWIANKAAAKAFGTAEKELKALIPADAKRAFGGGVDVSRAKNGNLTIRETKQ